MTGTAPADPIRVLLAEGNRFHLHLEVRALEEAGFEITAVGTRAEAIAANPAGFDVAVVSDRLEDCPGVDLVRELATSGPFPPVVLLVDAGNLAKSAEALAAGAAEQVLKTPDLAQPLRRAIARSLERARLLRTIADLQRQIDESSRIDPISGVYTPSYFDELLTRELHRLSRFGGLLSLIRLSSSTGTGIERTLGLHVRDRIVREIGAILQANLRLTDMAGTTVGGGFIIALTGTDRAGAEKVVERLGLQLAGLETRLGLAPGLVPQPRIFAAGAAADIRQVSIKD